MGGTNHAGDSKGQGVGHKLTGPNRGSKTKGPGAPRQKCYIPPMWGGGNSPRQKNPVGPGAGGSLVPKVFQKQAGGLHRGGGGRVKGDGRWGGVPRKRESGGAEGTME